MRQTIIILTILCWTTLLFGQNEKQLYDEFLKRQFDLQYIDKGNFDAEVFEYDFS